MHLPIPLWLLLAIIAPFIGCFLGVLIERIPHKRPVLLARSACDSCGQTLSAPDLFPLLSWLIAGAKCRYCGAPLGWFYPAIELSAIAIVLWAASVTDGCALAASCILGWTLVTLAVIDWRHFILPDVLTLSLLAAGLIAALSGILSDPLDHLIGAAAGVAIFSSIALVYARLRKRAGLGFGDAKLLGAIGAWVTWTGLPTVVLYATLAGLIVVMTSAAFGKRSELTDRIPFGAFLALGGWLVWLYGPLVISFN